MLILYSHINDDLSRNVHFTIYDYNHEATIVLIAKVSLSQDGAIAASFAGLLSDDLKEPPAFVTLLQLFSQCRI